MGASRQTQSGWFFCQRATISVCVGPFESMEKIKHRSSGISPESRFLFPPRRPDLGGPVAAAAPGRPRSAVCRHVNREVVE